ncbi:MAG: hypothetical protein IKR68_01635 [Lachnospiraceae bacterium]|nr:hypothetical protein [Lachnospiraceae bacterium]
MIIFDFKMDPTGEISRIVLDTGELTGKEKVSTLKEALGNLTIQNTAKTFARKIDSGEYEMRFTPNELSHIAEFADFSAGIWNTDYNPEVKAPPQDLRPYMTCLHLLENCFNLLLAQWRMINKWT